MRSWLLLAVLLVAAVLAVFLSMRDRLDAHRGSTPERTTVEAPASKPTEPEMLASTAGGSERAEIAAVPVEPVTAPDVSSWTGVRIRVTSIEDGRPLADVRVRSKARDRSRARQDADSRDPTPEQELRTDADGITELELEPGLSFSIEARPTVDSIGPRTVDVEPALAQGERRELSIALPTQPDVVFHGRVVDRETNAPMPDVPVGIRTAFGKIDAADTGRTDVDGRFRVVAASWRRTLFNVIAPGYAPACVVPVPGHATPERALEIPLSRVASVRITALDAAGAPLAGVEATLTTDGNRFGPDSSALLDAGGDRPVTYRARTGADGVAVVADLPARIPLVGRLARGRDSFFKTSEPLTLAPGEAGARTWRVGGGCTIHGIALEKDGRAAAGLSVCLERAPHAKPTYFRSDRTRAQRFPNSDGDGSFLFWDVAPQRLATTDGEGRFVFEDVGPGDWWIGPAPAKEPVAGSVAPVEHASRAQCFRVEPGAARVDVEIRVERGLAIAGRVVDPTGAAVSMASIVFSRPSEDLSCVESMRDASGRFVIGQLESGEYELRARSPGFAMSERVTARAGDTDVVLRLVAGGSVRGLVVEKATGEPTRARVVAFAGPLSDRRAIHLHTDERGIFQREGLEPGVWDFAASTTNGLFGVVRASTLEAGVTRALKIELEPGARVRVRYDGPSRACELTVLADGTAAATIGIEKGTEVVLGVPAASVVVRLRDLGGQSDLDLLLTLKVGETRDLVFDGAWK